MSEKNKVGITAGASTPDWLIREVVQLMNEENKEVNVESTENEEEKEQQVVEEVEETVTETTEEDEVTNSEEAEFKYSDNDIADLSKGQKVTGTVVEINENGVYVDVNYKTDGFIPLRHLSHRTVEDANDIVSMDEEIEVVILTLEDEEGNMVLSKNKLNMKKLGKKLKKLIIMKKLLKLKLLKKLKVV